MKSPLVFLAVVSMAILPSCVTRRSEFSPDNRQVTVGMPAKLSDRERNYIPDVDRALRDEGYTPVRYGRGDLDLEFEIAEGPINIDTTITLSERRREIAKGFGRAAGAPLLKRDKVADTSFNRAFEEFRSSLPGASNYGSRSENASGAEEYVY
jgi:hypothetical protein